MHRAYFLFLCFAGVSTCAVAQLPTNVAEGTITVRTTRIGETTGEALDMALRPDDSSRFFIAMKVGTIKVLRNGVFDPQPFLDISSGFGLVTYEETGLLGMTFHPQFSSAGDAGFGKFYTYTSEWKVGNADFFHPLNGPTGGAHHNVVREWTVDPTATHVTDVATASRVLFRSANPQSNHNGGAIKFGPDGMLYASLGDGGNLGINAQDPNLILGKIIRIDPTAENPANGRYGIPTDNPFAGAGVAGLDEIYASGLRNPFRMSFDRLTGKLYVGDVGKVSREEVNEVVLGGNYGWPYFEGTIQQQSPPADFESFPPLAEYGRSWGFSVIGGFVYRGTQIPELYGKYVFADAFNSVLRYMDLSGGQIYTLRPPSWISLISGSRYGWGEDAAGELYVLSSVGPIGHVYRIDAVPEPAAAGACAAALVLLARRREKLANRSVV